MEDEVPTLSDEAEVEVAGFPEPLVESLPLEEVWKSELEDVACPEDVMPVEIDAAELLAPPLTEDEVCERLVEESDALEDDTEVVDPEDTPALLEPRDEDAEEELAAVPTDDAVATRSGSPSLGVQRPSTQASAPVQSRWELHTRTQRPLSSTSSSLQRTHPESEDRLTAARTGRRRRE